MRPMVLSFLLLLSASLVTGPTAAQSSRQLGPADRPATLILPPSSAGKSLPLLVFLHGYSSSAQQSGQYFGFLRQQNALSYALLLPNGTLNSQGQRFWNATPECCDFEQSKVDDAAYLAGLIDEAASVASIDPGRVVLFGHSNGGFMAYKMACEYPEKVSAIVSVAGAFFKNPRECARPAPVSVLQIHGRLDEVIPYGANSRFASAEDSVDFWQQQLACEQFVTAPSSLDIAVDSGRPVGLSETDQRLWSQCADDRVVALWAMEGVGHLPYFKANWIAKALELVAP